MRVRLTFNRCQVAGLRFSCVSRLWPLCDFTLIYTAVTKETPDTSQSPFYMYKFDSLH